LGYPEKIQQFQKPAILAEWLTVYRDQKYF